MIFWLVIHLEYSILHIEWGKIFWQIVQSWGPSFEAPIVSKRDPKGKEDEPWELRGEKMGEKEAQL